MNSREPLPKNDGKKGLSASVLSFAKSALNYADARVKLLKAESSEAVKVGLNAGLLIALAALLALTAYVCGISCLAVWISRKWWGGDILPAVLTVAGLCVTAAILAVFIAWRSLSGKRLFRHTIEEFRTDKSWIQTTTQP